MPKETKDKVSPKAQPMYYVLTPIDQLLDEGLLFDGDDEKSKVVNQFDFSRIREVLQRFSTQLTLDQHETLVRYLKLCLKPECLE